MLIDWFTVICQIANFLILVIILKCLLFKRILKALDAREAEIAERLEKTEQAHEEANQQRISLEGESEAYALARDTRLRALESEIKALRKEDEETRRSEIEQARQDWQRRLREDQDQFLKKLKSLGLRHLTTAMRDALDSLANTSLERSMAQAFVDHLKSLPDTERHAILQGGSLRGDHEDMEIETRFPLAKDVQASLSAEIKKILQVDGNIQFLTKEAPGCGIRLRMAGHLIEWTLDHYFDESVHQLRERLQEDLKPEDQQAA